MKDDIIELLEEVRDAACILLEHRPELDVKEVRGACFAALWVLRQNFPDYMRQKIKDE